MLLGITLTGIFFWFLLAFPQLKVLHLSIERPEALRIATHYLMHTRVPDVYSYKTAIIFAQEGDADRYLQKAEGARSHDFLKAYDYELFAWVVRFFRPGQKEEYRVVVSPRDGRILQYERTIDESEARAEVSLGEARATAEMALTYHAHVDLALYEMKDVKTTKRDHRTDHGFTWKRRNVDMAWDKRPDAGTAKLLAGAVVSGSEALSFYKNDLSVPDGFNRYLDREQESGRILTTVFSIFYIILLYVAALTMIRSYQDAAVRTVRPFLLYISGALLILMILAMANSFSGVILGYPTSQAFWPFLGRSWVDVLITLFFVVAGFLLTALAGESACVRRDQENKKGSFLFYVRSTFLSRDIFWRVAVGYAAGCGLLGLQAILFAVGQKYFGVWSEAHWVAQFSSAYIPVVAAVAMGVRASLTEEVAFRVFVLNQVSTWAKNRWVGVIVSAAIWGFGHTAYLIFPTWFRGLEVTVLGLFLGWVYLRYGLVAVLVAHYSFDVFWASADCLFGTVHPGYFYSSLAVLLLPLAWGIAAYCFNGSEEERPWLVHLSQRLLFNAGILKAYVDKKRVEGVDVSSLQEECLRNGWDPVVVDEALGHEKKSLNS